MWRYDAGRTANSPHALPDQLEPVWTRLGTPRVPAWDDPLNLDLMQYDRLFEPVVLDGRMFVGHSDRDKLVALDVGTGAELWSVHVGGPVRLPPAAGHGAVFFASDDGRLTCVDVASGRIRWQFDGTPGPRRVIGNRRLISAWPARGGPVLRDGRVYFATSIWPFMGVFIYALDAETGRVEWVNDASGASYIKQPHSAPAFAGVAPQGPLVATAESLVVPGGRSVPAVFDRATGRLRYFELNAGGKGAGGSFVAATDDSFFVHTRQKGVLEFTLADGTKTAFRTNEPVLDRDDTTGATLLYSADVRDDETPVIRCHGADRELVWDIEADGRGDLIRAGDKLFAAGPTGLTAIRLPRQSRAAPEIVWRGHVPAVDAQAPADGGSSADDVERLLAASGRLFAVTRSGHLHAFAADPDGRPRPPVPVHRDVTVSLEPDEADRRRAEAVLAAGSRSGYALWFGAADERLLDAVAAASSFTELAVVDADADRVDRLRRRFDAAGLAGRVSVHEAAPATFAAAPYLAERIVVGAELTASLVTTPAALTAIYESLRPYGGTLQLLVPATTQPAGSHPAPGTVVDLVRAVGLEAAEIDEFAADDGADTLVVRRTGPLPGSAPWTHEHGDMANTRTSNDARVRLPLGVLWFGGSSNADVLPRHGHGPAQQIVGGRLFIEGIDRLSARDVYTGRVLWVRDFDDLGARGVYFDHTYRDTPLDTAYNQVHIPGANARGTNFVATPERVYVVEGKVCHLLDPTDGSLLQTVEMPQDDPADPRQWSFIGVHGDLLIGGLGFARYRDRLGLDFSAEDTALKGSKAGFGSQSLDQAGSLALVAFDRMSGAMRWRLDARHTFWHNGIVAGGGRLYCLDRNPTVVDDKLRRRGIEPPPGRLLAVDLETGTPCWEIGSGIFGTWLGYSAEHDLLLQAGAQASDRLTVEIDKGMAVHRGATGAIVWSQPDLAYSGPCVIHHDLVITNANSYRTSAGAFSLLTGEPHRITNPLTGVDEPWMITRSYGCNTILAAENLLTFRSGAAGFYDLTTHGGTGNFGGFRSGCTANLIAADGVLNAPDYTRTCSCGYQNQTSLALVHMPELEVWTVNHFAATAPAGLPVRSLGLNLGAAGQRRDAAGTLWVEWPTVTADQGPVTILPRLEPRPFRRHSVALGNAAAPAGERAWVFASGLEGAIDLEIATRLGPTADPPAKPSATKSDRRKARAESRAAAESQAQDQAQDQAQTAARAATEPFVITLYFGLPPGADAGDARRFDVVIDDEVVLPDVEVTGGAAVVQTLDDIRLGERFRLQLVPRIGQPVLCGLEIHRSIEAVSPPADSAGTLP